ncbi:Putative NADPH-quinone reductase (modulator of drug activity B) [Kingella potus]|uniref:NADPH-quinone reductase (Modulator of drug activity B) n=1 Tax=Kingella potus TaxID=265175 RepID=A0A377R0I1_9NEIS|nr:NAD(P)H-dependent oxidoreductase [Kingella potus]UOP01271.1 NAD(P)H-dependent oxidoreductase [Kingella potus]STR01003.1 Putative NADPH-quinone reductase (modulator of drug activity B) [Kingella potus]
MSRTLIVYDHPYEKSFNHAVLQTVTAALAAKNRAHDVIDLHADGFDPVYSKEELALFGKGQTLDPLVEKYQALIRAADEIIFICPIWWSSLPAMSKGFLDKVMKQQFAYLPTKHSTKGLLTHIKTATLITTSTAPNFAFALVLGNPIKRVFVKVVMKQFGFQKRQWLNFGGITASTAAQREAFLHKVRQRFA